MSSIKDIVKEAFRESGLLKDWEQPTRLQFDGGVTRLTKLISGVYGYEVGQPLVDWNLGNANRDYPERSTGYWGPVYVVPENSRLIANNESDLTIWLPSDPGDGSRVAIVDPLGTLASNSVTLDGNGRTIETAATVTPTVDTTWMYRADQGDWVVVSTLTATSDMPFPDEFDDFFIIMLAKRLNPKYGSSSHSDSERRLVQVLSKLRSRYKQTVEYPIELGIVGRRWTTSERQFKRGII